MRISIFPKVNPHPSNKEEKALNSRFSSSPYLPVIRDISDENQLVDTITNYAWSPSVFTKERKNDNFISTDFMVLDIDDGLSIDEAEKRCDSNKLCHLILPSPSYTRENPRFRVILPLVETIRHKDVFDDTWTYVCSIFPECDSACKDYARFYFGCKMDEGVFGEGELLVPIKTTYKKNQVINEHINRVVPVENYSDLGILETLYGEVPEFIAEQVDYFLKNAHTGIDGNWNNSLNACVFVLSLQGAEEERIFSVLRKVSPEELDKRDWSTIFGAIRRAKNIRE